MHWDPFFFIYLFFLSSDTFPEISNRHLCFGFKKTRCQITERNSTFKEWFVFIVILEVIFIYMALFDVTLFFLFTQHTPVSLMWLTEDSSTTDAKYTQENLLKQCFKYMWKNNTRNISMKQRTTLWSSDSRIKAKKNAYKTVSTL